MVDIRIARADFQIYTYVTYRIKIAFLTFVYLFWCLHTYTCSGSSFKSKMVIRILVKQILIWIFVLKKLAIIFAIRVHS